MLATLNFIVCALGAFVCLHALISTKLSTEHWARLSAICLMGLAFVDWLIFGMAFQKNLAGENIVGRALELLATFAFISALRQCNKKQATEQP